MSQKEIHDYPVFARERRKENKSHKDGKSLKFMLFY